MKNRGRHRRRKQGRALRAFLAGTALALTAAATMISASQATVGDNPGALTPLTRAAETGALRLQERLVPQATLDELSSGMGKPVGVGAVLETADRSLREANGCTPTERTALPIAPAATRAYCWDGADTRGWRAGAVTTSGDADDDGWWNDNRVILSGWNEGTADRGLARVAFVDANDLTHLRYASALLVVPVDGGRDYRALTSRLSGMVWYQDKLLVTAADGLYVYDMNRVQRATVDSAAVGRVPDGWSAHGQRFVLPAVGSYRLTGAGTARTSAASPSTAAPRPTAWSRASGLPSTATGRPGCGATTSARTRPAPACWPPAPPDPRRPSRRTRRTRPASRASCPTGRAERTAPAGTWAAPRAARTGTAACGARTPRARRRLAAARRTRPAAGASRPAPCRTGRRPARSGPSRAGCCSRCH